ncbi:hypothetical protein [Coraliomargarita sinensis]|nr:hypothetical protein [Coraliomargarita sinensis]
MTSEVWSELNKLKEAHPEVNFFWLEHELNNAGEEVDLLNEELEMMEAGA